MKIFILLLLTTCLTITSMYAQPIITAADIPREKDVFNYNYSKLAGVVAGNPGINQTWDYSTLVDTTFVDIDSSLNISSGPNASLFPGTNFVLHSISTNPGLVASLYSYQIKTASTYKTAGWVIPGANVFFRTPLTAIVPYPFTYGNTNTDSSIVVYQYNGVTDSITWIDYISAVGYGTLKLPGSRIYNNVLQLRRETTQRTRFGTTSKKINIIYFTPGTSGSLMSMEITSGSPALLRYVTTYSSLPLQWLDFTGTISNNQGHLVWKTANEVNTKYFVIERSIDGSHFTDIKQLPAQGNQLSEKMYEYKDTKPENGRNYYRIKSIDVDGKIAYSKTILLIKNQKSLELKVYPSIVQDQMNLQLYVSSMQKVEIKVIDAEGKVVFTKMGQYAQGNSSILINTSSLQTGAYRVVCNGKSNGNGVFIKQ